jgi:hypothetical protein
MGLRRTGLDRRNHKREASSVVAGLPFDPPISDVLFTKGDPLQSHSINGPNLSSKASSV